MPVTCTMWNVKSLIEHFAGVQVVGRPCNVRGVLEYHSNCPWCPGSEDSFIMRPEEGTWSHRLRSSGCPRGGDMVDFLRQYKEMSYGEALEFLGLGNTEFSDAKPVQRTLVDSRELPPPARWQSTGWDLVARAQAALWGPPGKEMLDYLRGRGLADDTIKKYRLGYVPLQGDGRYAQFKFEDWGLIEEMLSPDQIKKGCVRVPNGILIPWFEGETLWRLALKRPGETVSYGQIMGSGEGLFNVDSIDMDKPVMMTEGELCAMSVEQEAGDLVACVATGSTTRARINRWLSDLSFASFLLQSFDEDKAGEEGAEYWLKIKKSMRWSPLMAKDPNDILTGKFNSECKCTLREWVEAGVGVGRAVIFPPKEEAPIVIEVPRVALPAPLIEVPPCKEEETIDISLIKFYERTEEMKQTIVSEYQLMGLVPSSHPKPLNLCKDHPPKQWFWSATANEWACLECLLGQCSYTKKQAKSLANRTW